MEDRAKQALMKLALEPEWEAKFEPHSYGFRPARSTHDALGYIHNALSGSKEGKWVYDADIAGCFDNINHDYLLDKLNTLPTFRRQIKAWLKSGAITFSNLEPKKEYTPSMAGTPQGGVLSPLLANIALHGLENRLKEWLWNEKKYRIPRWNATDKRMGTEKKERTISSITVVRYADDLLVIHKDKEIIEEAKAVVEEFLKPIGLQIKEAKTKIVHSTEGFDFLGTNIRHYPTGEYRSSKTVKGERTGLTLLIKPSQTSIKKHYRRIAEIINNHNALSQGILIRNLNPIIKGWGNYYKPYVAKEAFSKLDNLIHYRLRRWAKRRHPSKKSTHWIMNRYFDTKKGWQFRDGGITLATHAEIEIERHTIVKGESSIFDGDITYWAKRVKKHPLLNDTELKLMNKQKGICLYCKSKFHEGDLWEVDHRIPRSMGGSKSFSNLQLIHRHCHDAKTREDMNKNRKNSVRNHTQSQEPYEVKVSSTVLETSGSRETDT
jgi:RNA-directed DNA polymerase